MVVSTGYQCYHCLPKFLCVQNLSVCCSYHHSWSLIDLIFNSFSSLILDMFTPNCQFLHTWILTWIFWPGATWKQKWPYGCVAILLFIFVRPKDTHTTFPTSSSHLARTHRLKARIFSRPAFMYKLLSYIARSLWTTSIQKRVEKIPPPPAETDLIQNNVSYWATKVCQ